MPLRHARPSFLTLLASLVTLGVAQHASVALAANVTPHESITYVDGNRSVVAELRGPMEVDSHGRKRWPVRIAIGSKIIDSSVDHLAIVRIDPNNKNALQQANLRIVQPLMPSIGIYSVESLGDENGLDIAVRLAKPAAKFVGIRDAIPNLYLRIKPLGEPFVPNDPRFPAQWFFDDKRLHMTEAWGITQGDPNTSIVVIDTGCDITHPDLADKLDPGLDVIDNDDDPSYDPIYTDNAHGTAAAGLVAASTNNAEGIAGACPACRMRCVRMLSDVALSLDAHLKAFNFAFDTNAAVVSNSWGFADPIPVPSLLRDAINNLFDNGRGGKGTLVFFAAGNEDREVADNELTAVRGVTSIGAINNFFDKTFYTNYGPSLDLVAPVGTLTTDIFGPGGYDPTDYTTKFGGTSSACPVAAGVAALVMSAAPNKTAAEIQEILIRTARPAPYASPDANGHDPVFGYGIINPVAALKDALGIVDELPDAGPDASPNPKPNEEAEASCACRIGARNSTADWVTFGFNAAFGVILLARRRARR